MKSDLLCFIVIYLVCCQFVIGLFGLCFVLFVWLISFFSFFAKNLFFLILVDSDCLRDVFFVQRACGLVVLGTV